MGDRGQIQNTCILIGGINGLNYLEDELEWALLFRDYLKDYSKVE